MVMRMISLIIFSISMFITVYFFSMRYLKKIQIQKKLYSDSTKEMTVEEREKIYVVYHLINSFKDRLTNIMPGRIKEKFEIMLKLSGSKLKLGDLILAKLVLLLVAFIINTLLITYSSNSRNNTLLLLLISITLFIIPDFLLKRKIKARQDSIRRSLPAFIDYLTISVEAGLGMDSAIFRVIKHIRGPMAEEMAYAMTEIQYGKTKKEAFKNLSKRVNIPELDVFLTALVNGDSTGIGLSTILRIQAQQLRQKRKQQIQEAAYKISIKLLFPLVIFILPSLFIILLGPAIIKMYTIFVK